MNPKTLHKISYGVYIISSKKQVHLNGDKYNGQIANTVFQITSEPPTIAISINKQNLTHQFIEESKVFSVSILGKEAPMPFIGNFGFKSGKEIDKFKDIDYKIGISGAPIVLGNSIGYLEAEVVSKIDVGTHTVFIGKVVDADLPTEQAGILNNNEPMTYTYYHEVKQGKSPKTAPTYIPIETTQELPKQEEATKMAKYKCLVCGYIYDPEKGDPDSGVKPGTSFKNIPDDWVCPVCGVGKDQFEKEE